MTTSLYNTLTVKTKIIDTSIEMNKQNDSDPDEDQEDMWWGESEQTWSKEGRNFYIIETYYIPGHLMDKLDKLIPKHDSVSIYM